MRLTLAGSSSDADASLPTVPRRTTLLAVYTAAMILAGLAALATATVLVAVAPDGALRSAIAIPGVEPPLAGVAGVAVWTLFALVGGTRMIRDPGGHGTLTFHLPFIAAALLLGGPVAGAWVAVLGTIDRRELSEAPWYGILANRALLALSALAAGLIMEAVLAVAEAAGVAGGANGLVAWLVAGLAGTAVLGVVSALLMAGVIVLRDGLEPGDTLVLIDRAFRRTAVAETLLGWVFVVVWLAVGWWAPALLAGVVLMLWRANADEAALDHDELTGVLTRRAFALRVAEAAERARRGVDGAAYLFLDLDDFKALNDGPRSHHVGDQVLAALGERLRRGVRVTDSVGRRGGDEFTVLLAGVSDESTAELLARRIHDLATVPYVTDEGLKQVGASIGVALAVPGGRDFEPDLRGRADAAMYEAKDAGGGVRIGAGVDPGLKVAHTPSVTSQRPEDPGTTDRPTMLERVANQRDGLRDVSNALAQLLDPQAVATRILEAACAVLDAPQGWVVTLTPGGDAVEMLAAIGFTDDVVAPWARVSLETPIPMTEVVRTGRPLYHRTAAERRAAFPALAVPQRGDDTPVEGSAVIPLGLEGGATGALAVAFREPRLLDEDERWFLAALAAQGSQALERARLFAEIQDRDARLRFTLQASGTGTWEWEIAQDASEWSPEVRRIHGLGGDATPPGFGEWLETLHPDDRRPVRAAIREALRTGDAYDVEYRVLRADGSTCWAHSVGRMVRDADGHPARLLGTTRDITDRKFAEAEHDRMVEAEREAAQLRDAFIGVVSHELRTPITTIYGGTRVLARRWRDMEPVARDDILRDIAEEADRLYRLVEDLLVLTRVERGSLDIGDEPIHLGRIVERVVASERARWPEVAFEAVVAPGVPSAAGEESYVEQVLRNLLGNAAKYGGPGSTVIATADAVEDGVRLRVFDEGPGIDEAELDRLFDLFYRSPATAATVGGAGIGLFVCRRLVAAMGGRITAERRPEGGSAFVVTLPPYLDDDVP